MLGLVSVGSGCWEGLNTPCSCLYVGNQPDQRIFCSISEQSSSSMGPVPGLGPCSYSCREQLCSHLAQLTRLPAEWRGSLGSDVTGPHAVWEMGHCSRQAGCSPGSVADILCKVGHTVPIIPDQ